MCLLSPLFFGIDSKFGTMFRGRKVFFSYNHNFKLRRHGTLFLRTLFSSPSIGLCQRFCMGGGGVGQKSSSCTAFCKASTLYLF